MNALEIVLTLVFGLVAFDLIAWRWGADTREGQDWQWRPDGPAQDPRRDLRPGASRSDGRHA